MCILTLDQTGIGMGDLPTWVSAFAAIILAIITYRYVRLVKAQSDTMTDQGRIMQESIKRDQIVRKYDRLVKEMDNLVGPLYSKMDDHTAPFFELTYHSHERVTPLYQEIYAFWRDIKKDVYLAPNDLRESLNKYLDAKQKSRWLSTTRGPPDEVNTARDIFVQSIEELKPKIKNRYTELSGQLEECKRELES